MINIQEHSSISEAIQPAPRPRLHYLDGLRGLAALYVVMHHCWQSQGNFYSLSGWRGIATNWLQYGHLAVDVFIVLSGFCLILPVVRTGDLAGGALAFFRRRAQRILPPLYSVLIICYLLNLFMHHFNPQIARFTPKLFLINLLLLQDILHRHNMDGPLWSVALEWKIYFLFPAIVWGIKRFGQIAVLGCTAVLGYGIAFGIHDLRPEFWLFQNCPWYLFLFTMGVCGGIIAFQQEQSMPKHFWAGATGVFALILGGLLLMFPVEQVGRPHVYEALLPLIDAVAGALTACGLVALSLAQRRHQSMLMLRLLSWSPLVLLGSFSYSLYLIHAPLMQTFNIVVAILHLNSVALPLLFIVGIPLIIASSYLFYLAVERPFLNHKNRPSGEPSAASANVT